MAKLRVLPILLALTLCARAAFAQGYDRFHEFVNISIKSPVFWLEGVGGGVIDQANGFPVEWETEDHALAKRAAARIGQSFVLAIMETTAAAALHQHVGYQHCMCRGALRRTGHAVWRTFVQRHVDGHLVLNVPFLAAKYGSAVAANAWYPESYKRADVVGQATFAVGTAVGLNLLAEFSPDLLHALHLK